MNQQMLGHDIPILHTFDIQLFPRVAADVETELTRPQCGVLLQFAAQKNYSRTGNSGWVLLCFSYSCTKILPWYLFKEMLEHVQLTESCLVPLTHYAGTPPSLTMSWERQRPGDKEEEAALMEHLLWAGHMEGDFKCVVSFNSLTTLGARVLASFPVLCRSENWCSS